MIIRSPFFYVGDKYKLMEQLQKLFPENISSYYEPFVGGGSSFLNTNAKKYFLNDIDSNIINLHNYFLNQPNKEEFINQLITQIKKYKLSCSLLSDDVPQELKQMYPKTYYAKYNSNSYKKLKSDYNENNDNELLYLLLIYGFNHMIRFNSKKEFNLPVGNVDFNKNVKRAIENYLDFVKNKNINFFNFDFEIFLERQTFEKNDFIYFDPPYLISMSEYNSLWNEEKEKKLYSLLDDLNDKNIKWGITNLLNHKGKHNEYLSKWMRKYKVYEIKSNYISFNDNTKKMGSKEVYVTNYGKSNF